MLLEGPTTCSMYIYYFRPGRVCRFVEQDHHLLGMIKSRSNLDQIYPSPPDNHMFDETADVS